jgi:quinohemoprotein amine dehydrogenase
MLWNKTYMWQRTAIVQSMVLFCFSRGTAATYNVTQSPIPIDDQVTIAKCGGCHRRSETGMMRRLSYIRTTPEVWEQAIKRMVRLHGVMLSREEASHIVRYLSENNGLAPEEAKPIFWEAEHRLFRDQEDPALVPEPMQHVCNYCHTIGRVLGQRRTREDYEKLANTHVALFPYTDIMVFRPTPSPVSVDEIPVTAINVGTFESVLNFPTAPEPVDGKAPIDAALDYLADKQPLITPQWSAWKAVMRPPKLAGTWLISGYQKGKGRVFGEMVVEAGASAEDFTTRVTLQYASSGQEVKRSGKGVVYTGYSWRGRTKVEGAASSDPSFSPAEMKEALFVERDGSSMQGRWFWGGYDEFGIDVHLTLMGTGIVLHGTDKFSVQSPSTGELRVFGANLPTGLRPADFDLGPGIKVTSIAESKSTQALLAIEVAPGVAPGMHDVALRGATAVKAFAVYDRVSYIKVMPDASFARLGGTIAAKQYAQFEAMAFANGPDGQPGTDDDLPLGPVTANWSLEEFFSGPNDDDVKFVGKINDEGLFTPSFEGPNPERKKQYNNFGTDNYGDVWVGASYNTGNGPPLKAKSFLVVTVPLYIHYDQPEVSQ